MRWSWHVGRLAGIDVYIHWTFLILVLWFLVLPLTTQEGRDDIAQVVTNFVFVLAIFGCVVLHELGHALTARRYGIATRDITLLPIGGLARLERMPDDPRQEFWVALAGPAVNAVIAAALAIALLIGGKFAGNFFDVDYTQLRATNFFYLLMVANIVLLVFNLLPAFPMDGGRVLRAMLAKRMDYVRATQTAASIGQAMAILFGIAGLLLPNPFLVFIALFVFLGAGQEASMVETRISMQGLPVRAAMMTRFRALSPTDTIDVAAQELMAGAQQDFPVVDGARVVGMLRRDDLFRAVRDLQQLATIGDVMHRNCPIVSDNQMLEAVFTRMQHDDCKSLPVVRGDQLVGLITLENIGELLMLRQSRELARGATPEST